MPTNVAIDSSIPPESDLDQLEIQRSIESTESTPSLPLSIPIDLREKVGRGGQQSYNLSLFPCSMCKEKNVTVSPDYSQL
jgi:hypothetical protein